MRTLAVHGRREVWYKNMCMRCGTALHLQFIYENEYMVSTFIVFSVNHDNEPMAIMVH